MWDAFGTEYREALFNSYDLPKTSDLCCYWFELARRKIEAAKNHIASGSPGVIAQKPMKRSLSRKTSPGAPDGNPVASLTEINLSLFPEISLPRIGLLAPPGIRGGDNRTVLERIKQTGDIFMAWSDKDWFLEGATVHVSIAGFSGADAVEHYLNGIQVPKINANLTSEVDLTAVNTLEENAEISFRGTQKYGDFDLPYPEAHKMLRVPSNPNGSQNSQVLVPWANGRGSSRSMERSMDH